MWVSAADRALWEEMAGERSSPPAALAPEDDDLITFAEQEIDRTCRAGEEGSFVSNPRPVRDYSQPTGGLTLPRMPIRRPRDPMRITHVERAAASAALGCRPWELGPCAGCGQLMRRYGRFAAMYCRPCRDLLNGR
jgi:hypothetical protein